MKMLLFILSLVFLWILIGVALYLLVGPNPKPDKRPLTRSIDRRLCLVGDTLEVTLRCSATGLPWPQIDDSAPPWDLVLVIDHSASMGSGTGSALQEAHQAAINLVRTTPGGFRFAVVEFDHEAQEVCPLTDRKPGLIRAVKGIGRGGATDIARGLEVAGKSMERAAAGDRGRRRAVVLLSDGGSAADPATAAADQLKRDPDLRLITVGIGAADMPLLRRLASTPDHCFHADRIDELAALYSEIGHMITGREATQVKVSEHFSTTGRFGLRDWGELQPAAFSLKDGEFSWLLATLQERPVALQYSVEALCPGWQPVAPQPALLHAKIATDDLRNTPSNAGPRVLILPRVPGWQLLWPILNPLFFLLFGRSFRCEQGVAVRSEPVPPRPQALDLPPLLEPTRSPEPTLSVRPTLIIGLGYAGIQTLVHSKRLAWERGERLDLGRLRFLALDTTDELFFPPPHVGLVRLEADEHMTLDCPLEPIISAAADAPEPDYPWLEAPRLRAGGARPDLHRGTGHERSLGRLALLANRTALEARIGPLLDALIACADDRGIDILITAGSGGGTGSGGLLDLCWLVRHLLDQRGYGDSSTTLFLSAPHAEQAIAARPEERAMRQANHLALLGELDRFSTLRGEPLAPAPGLTPLRRWFDRVFWIGPADLGIWRAEQVLYPKTAEAVFAWLADDQQQGLRAHFVAQDAVNNDHSRRLGRCLVHRIEPSSHYLYPLSLHIYLVVDTLRRTLADRLWGLARRGSLEEYSADAHTPEGASALVQAWLEARPQDADYPWVFNALNTLEDPTRLQQSLNHGAGPEISGGISPLARNELLDEQRRLVHAALDSWLVDTLNTGSEGVCEPHALALCIHALRELRRRLHAGSATATHLVAHSPAPVVRREAETVVELATQALTETETMVRRLTDWDHRLGEGREGSEGSGVMRLLDERHGLLHREIEALRDAGCGSATARSPRLPLSWEQIAALPERLLPDLSERLSERIGWSIERAGTQVHLYLHLQGAAARRWSPEDLDPGGVAISELADVLLRIGADLSPAFATWGLADHDPATLPELRVGRPRSDQLNPGARGRYLIQGEGAFQAAAHVEQIKLTPCDRREARIVACEEHLAGDYLWPGPETPTVPPFVFTEEHHAYRGYDAYCRAENHEPAPLAPTLIGLCRDPEALLGFALEGLAGGRIRARDDGLRHIWCVQGIDGLDQRDLAQDAADPLVRFQRVANGWIGADEPALRCFTPLTESAPATLAPTALADRIAGHELARAISDDPWYEQLIAVLWGWLRWQ